MPPDSIFACHNFIIFITLLVGLVAERLKSIYFRRTSSASSDELNVKSFVIGLNSVIKSQSFKINGLVFFRSTV